MLKVFVITPDSHTDALITAMADAGAGVIGNYSHNAFIIKGMGNWFSGEGANPTSGEVGKMSREEEVQIQMVCPEDKLDAVIQTTRETHPYEEPAIDVYQLVTIS